VLTHSSYSVAPSCVLGRYSPPGTKTLADTGSTFALASALLLNQSSFPPHDETGFQPVRALPLFLSFPLLTLLHTQEHYISVNDVARAHVDAALHPSVSNGKRYLLVADRSTWEPIAREMLKAESALKGHLPPLPEKEGEEEKARSVFRYDAEGVKRDFGWKCTSRLSSLILFSAVFDAVFCPFHRRAFRQIRQRLRQTSR
jgi:hypothetical protein